MSACAVRLAWLRVVHALTAAHRCSGACRPGAPHSASHAAGQLFDGNECFPVSGSVWAEPFKTLEKKWRQVRACSVGRWLMEHGRRSTSAQGWTGHTCAVATSVPGLASLQVLLDLHRGVVAATALRSTRSWP